MQTFIAERHTIPYLISVFWAAISFSEYAITKITVRSIADLHVIFPVNSKKLKCRPINVSLESALKRVRGLCGA